MSTTITFQKQHSRNTHDWTASKTKEGRVVLSANEKGVSLRIGLLVRYLAKHGKSSATELCKHLQTVNKSYTTNDLSQPMKQMAANGIVDSRGKGPGTVYQLTNNGKRIWDAATHKWA